MPELTVKLGETMLQRYVFDKDIFSIGRSRDNDVVIETLSVSRNHARIRREGDHYVLVDLESANGTFVNGVRISRAEIQDGDVIVLGKHSLHFAMQALSEEQVISEAFNAERTMLVQAEVIGVLVVMQGKQKNQEFIIDRAETVIGRADGCHIQLFDWFVSKRHAVIRREGDRFLIRDFGRLTGVQVNGKIIRTSHPLLDGDEVKIGPVVLKFTVRTTQPLPRLTGRKPVELPSPVQREEQEEVAHDIASLMAMADRETLDSTPDKSGEEALFKLPAHVLNPESSLALDDTPEPEFELPLNLAPAQGYSTPPVAEAMMQEEDDAFQAAEFADPNIIHPEWYEEVITPGEEEGEAQASAPPAQAPELKVEPPVVENTEAPAAESVSEAPAPTSASSEVALWEKALQNPSPIIRREAARRLKKLTGREYDV